MSMVMEENLETEDVNVQKIELYIPKWVEMLPVDHPVKQGLIEKMKELLQTDPTVTTLMEDAVQQFRSLEFVSNAAAEYPQPKENAIVKIRMDVEDQWYYEMLSHLTGVSVSGEYQLISMIRELSAMREEYQNARQAVLSARNTGYGVIFPMQNEIVLDEPVVIKQGSKFGVRIKASCPSIHLIRTEVETEISPIVGSEQQAEDLINYIKSSSKTEEGIWETNIFGKSIEQLTNDGIRSKLAQIDEESQQKLQNMMQRIVNESAGGFICIIL